MAQPKTIRLLNNTGLEAMRFQGTPDKLQDVSNWVGGTIFADETPITLEFPLERRPQSQGGHFWRVVNLGEWIIKDSDGSFAVMTDETFKSMYEVVQP